MSTEENDNKDKNFNAGKLGQFVKSGKTGAQLAQDAAAIATAAKFNKDSVAAVASKAQGELSDGQLQTQTYKHIYGPDGSDAKGNAGFTVSLQHVPSEESVYFKAFLTAFNETYKTEWASETVYGRPDPIFMFKGTTRTVSVGLTLPAATVGEGFENMSKLQKLIQFLYPTYEDPANALSITQSPLIRLKIMNLLSKVLDSRASLGGTEPPGTQGDHLHLNTNIAGDGVLGQISNLTIDHGVHDPSVGSFEINKGTILPKAVEIQFDFTVLHEHPLGWDVAADKKDLEFSAPYFPYSLKLDTFLTADAAANAKEKAAAAAKAKAAAAIAAADVAAISPPTAPAAAVAEAAEEAEPQPKVTQQQRDSAKATVAVEANRVFWGSLNGKVYGANQEAEYLRDRAIHDKQVADFRAEGQVAIEAFRAGSGIEDALINSR
jgi:hypothetical protein